MTYQEFVDRVSKALKHGTAYDSTIPEYVGDAIKDLEDMHNWRHMWNIQRKQTLVAGQREIVLNDGADPQPRVKAVRFLRFYITNPESPQDDAAIFKYASRLAYDDPAGEGEMRSFPNSKVFYTVEENNKIRLTTTFQTDHVYDVGWFNFSTNAVDSLPWLSVNPGLLLAATMVLLGGLEVRDDKVMARWANVYAERLARAEEADIVEEFEGEDLQQVPFTREMGDYMFARDNDRRT